MIHDGESASTAAKGVGGGEVEVGEEETFFAVGLPGLEGAVLR